MSGSHVRLAASPSLGATVGQSLTMARRGLLRIRHDPQRLFDVVALPVVATVMFANVFGGAVAGGIDAYLPRLVPGVMVQIAVTASVVTGVQLRDDMERGVFDRFRSLPIWRPAPIVGALMGDTVRYTIASVITVGLGLAIGFRPTGGVVGVLLAVALLLVFAFAISWIFTILGLVMRTPNAVMGVSMLVLMPLTFASNIFVDPDTMPSALRTWAEINPVSHLATAVRALMAGTATFDQIGWVLLASVLLTAVFAPITMHLYRTRN